MADIKLDNLTTSELELLIENARTAKTKLENTALEVIATDFYNKLALDKHEPKAIRYIANALLGIVRVPKAK